MSGDLLGDADLAPIPSSDSSLAGGFSFMVGSNSNSPSSSQLQQHHQQRVVLLRVAAADQAENP